MTLAQSVKPAYLHVPSYTDTEGPAVARLCADLAGFTPDPEQALALDAIFALDGKGRAAVFETAVIACRQNLKTGVFKMAALGWLFVTAERLIVWSAHNFSTAAEAFRDLDELITGSDVLRAEVKAIYRGNGDESIELRNGARLVFKTRTKGGGRGLTGDKVILDEAFALQAMHMGALLPTLSARPDPQVLYGSSAGLAESDVLRDLRDRGRAGNDDALAYFEWCAPDGGCAAIGCDHRLDAEGCALDSRENWRRANPALGRRISEAYIAKERRAMPPHEFARERLGWWDAPAVDASDLDLTGWAASEDATSGAASLTAFAVEISLDRDAGVIAAAGPSAAADDDRVHLEIVEHRRGLSWIVPRCIELDEAHGPAVFVIDSYGPAASLVPEIEAAGIQVETTSTDDIATAAASFMDGLAERRWTHGPQREVDDAIAGARKRSLGDGRFTFGRLRSGGDVTPLVAIALAAWGHDTHGAVASVFFFDDLDRT